MQQVERRDVSKNRLSPVKGAIIVAALALAGGTFLILSKDHTDRAPTPPPTNEPATTLTNAEAITTFSELSRIAQDAMRQRDVSLLPAAFASGSPLLGRAQAEIKSLLSDRVEDHSSISTLAVHVLKNGESQIEFEEKLRIIPCFVTESGRDVTTSPQPVTQISTWIARVQSDGWRLYDAKVTDRRTGKARNDVCR